MAVIALTITPSTTQLISGIPETVSITANISSVIFYTLDGSDPDVSSSVYTSAITLPTDSPSVNLKVFATNGTDSSAIVSVVYSPDMTHDRLPRSKVQILNNIIRPACGSNGGNKEYLYSQPSTYTLDAFGVSNKIGDGYGATPSDFPVRTFDAPIPTYLLKFSDSDSEGHIGEGIGNLPPKAKILYLPPPVDPTTTDGNLATFNPRAMVLYLDGTKPNENKNEYLRPFSDSGNTFEKDMYGSRYSTVGMRDGNFLPSTTFMKYYYNPKDNTITFYYRDNITNQWIISKENYTAASQSNAIRSLPATGMRYIGPNSGAGTGHVYKWILFGRTATL